MNVIIGSCCLNYWMVLMEVNDMNFIGGGGEIEILFVGFWLGNYFFYGSFLDYVEISINYFFGIIGLLVDD